MKDIYRIGEWDNESLGNHRLLIQVEEPGEVARCEISWRRSDPDPEKKGVFVRARDGENFIQRVHVKKITKEQLDMIFETVPGVTQYEIYYMRYEGTTRAPYPVITYTPIEACLDKDWVAHYEPLSDTFAPAKLVAFESCSEFHSFYPMEIPAYQSEVEELTKKHLHRSFLVFPERRENSIRMKKDLASHWIERGPFALLGGKALRGEYYVFQLGIFAHKKDITLRNVSFVSEDGSNQKPWDGTCFNLEGTSYKGEPFAKILNVRKGEVQALWVGVQIPEDLPAGEQRLVLYVEGGGDSTNQTGYGEQVAIDIQVLPEVIRDRGDDEPWRLSRLRWLDSALGSEDTVMEPFTPVKREGSKFKILGREIFIGTDGLPHAIDSYYTPEITGIGSGQFPILCSPMELSVIQETGELVAWERNPIRYQDRDQATQLFSQTSTNTYLEQRLEASVEPDGCLFYTITFTGKQQVQLEDIRLTIPFAPEVLRYILGLGFVGGYLEDQWEWHWNVQEKQQDSVWIGCERGGLQIFLSGDNYRRPLNTNFYRVQPLLSPSSWDNNGRGGISFKRSKDQAVLSCFSGSRTIQKDETVVFNLRFLITPFRPIDTYKQWTSRFIHEFESPDKVKESRANVINIHHAKRVNPYINYPFLRSKELKEYIDEAHSMDIRVRLYYTIRELTNHAPELFALRSLGNEIFSSGPGGGHSWLQEHLREDYIAAWHVFEYGCCAITNTGTSRWTNFYIEGLDWLARNLAIDGVYIDDSAFGRDTAKRLRRILDSHRKDALIDLHSANQYNEKDGYANSINMYMENLPYIDRLWFGEYFDYSRGPEYWMTEVAGIPFGIMGEMLQDGGDLWRGMLYGMTSRYPHENGDPRRLWEIWDEFGITESDMYGYWSPNVPITTSYPDSILTTVYLGGSQGGSLLSIASWEDQDVDISLTYNWDKLKLSPENVELRAPYIKDFQEEAVYPIGECIPIKKNQGALLILQKKV